MLLPRAPAAVAGRHEATRFSRGGRLDSSLRLRSDTRRRATARRRRRIRGSSGSIKSPRADVSLHASPARRLDAAGVLLPCAPAAVARLKRKRQVLAPSLTHRRVVVVLARTPGPRPGRCSAGIASASLAPDVLRPLSHRACRSPGSPRAPSGSCRARRNSSRPIGLTWLALTFTSARRGCADEVRRAALRPLAPPRRAARRALLNGSARVAGSHTAGIEPTGRRARWLAPLELARECGATTPAQPTRRPSSPATRTRFVVRGGGVAATRAEGESAGQGASGLRRQTGLGFGAGRSDAREGWAHPRHALRTRGLQACSESFAQGFARRRSGAAAAGPRACTPAQAARTARGPGRARERP